MNHLVISKRTRKWKQQSIELICSLCLGLDSDELNDDPEAIQLASQLICELPEDSVSTKLLKVMFKELLQWNCSVLFCLCFTLIVPLVATSPPPSKISSSPSSTPSSPEVIAVSLPGSKPNEWLVICTLVPQHPAPHPLPRPQTQKGARLNHKVSLAKASAF